MLIACTVTLLLSTCLCLAVVPSPKQAELTLRGCTLATGAVPLCLEWRQEMRQEKAPKDVVFMLPTLCINFLPWDHEKGKHCIQWKDVYHQHKTRLSWRSNSPLRRWCFINWAMLLRAELLTTLRWGRPVHEPHVSRSIKYSYQVKLSEFSSNISVQIFYGWGNVRKSKENKFNSQQMTCPHKFERFLDWKCWIKGARSIRDGS